MKTLSKILLAVWLLGAMDANAELKKFVYKAPVSQDGEVVNSATLTIKEGEVVIPKSLWSSGKLKQAWADASHGAGVSTRIVFSQVGGARTEDYAHPIIGPASIKFNLHYNFSQAPGMVFIYDLQKTTTSTSSSSLPSNTVVIPTDASGPVEIVMESSKDLVNWTRAEPGTYGADTPKRFFRIRAVVKP
ncbi:hypothetical protein N8584_00090 [bacterium]|nr:hypothetical protein [bacterium]MDA7680006.1 hypothetical protein [bacterium]